MFKKTGILLGLMGVFSMGVFSIGTAFSAPIFALIEKDGENSLCLKNGGEESVCVSRADLLSAVHASDLNAGPGHQGWYIKVADIRPSGPMAENDEGPGTLPLFIEQAQDWPVHTAGPGTLPLFIEQAQDWPVHTAGPGTLPFVIEKAEDWPIHTAGPTFMIKPANANDDDEGFWLIRPAKDVPIHVAGPTVLIKPASANDDDEGFYFIKFADGPVIPIIIEQAQDWPIHTAGPGTLPFVIEKADTRPLTAYDWTDKKHDKKKLITLAKEHGTRVIKPAKEHGTRL